jgi:hypothetical protein
MEILRKVFAVLLFLVSVALLASLGLVFSLRFMGMRGAVSQVFKKSLSVPLARGYFVDAYAAAITPVQTSEVVRMCPVYTVTRWNRADLLEKKVWMWPPDRPWFAYYENRETKEAFGVLCGAGLALLAASGFLFVRRD